MRGRLPAGVSCVAILPKVSRQVVVTRRCVEVRPKTRGAACIRTEDADQAQRRGAGCWLAHGQADCRGRKGDDVSVLAEALLELRPGERRGLVAAPRIIELKPLGG